MLLQNVGMAKLFDPTRHGHVLPTDSVSLQVSTGECPLTLSVRVPSSKAYWSGEGVAVDKIRKCGRYKAYTALVGSAPLHWLIFELYKIHELKSAVTNSWNFWVLKISRCIRGGK